MIMKRICAWACIGVLVAGAAAADVSTTKPMDPNNASYSKASVITVGGSSIAATRGVAADCTGAGTATLTMSGGRIALLDRRAWPSEPAVLHHRHLGFYGYLHLLWVELR